MMETKLRHDVGDRHLFDEHGAPEPQSELSEEPEATPHRRALPLGALHLGTLRLGYVAFAIAVLLVIAEAVAITLANGGEAAAATTIGQILVVLTALPLALGLFVVIRGPKRECGIAAMVVAVIANPLILITVLSFFGTF